MHRGEGGEGTVATDVLECWSLPSEKRRPTWYYNNPSDSPCTPDLLDLDSPDSFSPITPADHDSSDSPSDYPPFSPFHRVPPEIFAYISCFFSLRTFVSVTSTCKSFRRFFYSPPDGTGTGAGTGTVSGCTTDVMFRISPRMYTVSMWFELFGWVPSGQICEMCLPFVHCASFEMLFFRHGTASIVEDPVADVTSSVSVGEEDSDYRSLCRRGVDSVDVFRLFPNLEKLRVAKFDFECSGGEFRSQHAVFLPSFLNRLSRSPRLATLRSRLVELDVWDMQHSEYGSRIQHVSDLFGELQNFPRLAKLRVRPNWGYYYRDEDVDLEALAQLEPKSSLRCLHFCARSSPMLDAVVCHCNCLEELRAVGCVFFQEKDPGWRPNELGIYPLLTSICLDSLLAGQESLSAISKVFGATLRLFEAQHDFFRPEDTTSVGRVPAFPVLETLAMKYPSWQVRTLESSFVVHLADFPMLADLQGMRISQQVYCLTLNRLYMTLFDTEILGWLPSFPNLREFVLRIRPPHDQDSDISDEAEEIQDVQDDIPEINCRVFQSLVRLSINVRVAPERVAPGFNLIELHRLRGLERLRLSGALCLPDVADSACFPRMKAFKLASSDVDWGCVVTLLNGMPSLEFCVLLGIKNCGDEFLQSKPSVSNLELRRRGMSCMGLVELLTAFYSLECLNLVDIVPYEASLFKQVPLNRSMRELSLPILTLFDSGLSSMLCRFPCLEILRLQARYEEPESEDRHAFLDYRCNTLREVVFPRFEEDIVSRFFHGCPGLRRVQFGGGSFPRGFLESLPPLQDLRCLDLYSVSVGSLGLGEFTECLLRAYPSLECLFLPSCWDEGEGARELDRYRMRGGMSRHVLGMAEYPK